MQFGDRKLFSNIDLLIRRGDRIALIGSNGTGKTTLLKILLGQLQPTHGRIKIGSKVQIGYFSQHHEDLDDENTIIDEIVENFGCNEETARNYLGAFLFRGDEVFKKISDLSGGEKARIAFLKLLLTGANFLVLDEPTNHLDIPAKETIETALKNFPGTILLVSHDRYFIRATTDKICRLSQEKFQIGGFELLEYVEEKIPTVVKKSHEVVREKPQSTPNKKTIIDDSQLDRLEAQIKMTEFEIKAIEIEMNDSTLQSDPIKSQEIADRYAEKNSELDRLYKIFLDGSI